MPKIPSIDDNWIFHNPVKIASCSLDNLTQFVKGGNVLLVTTRGFIKRGVVDRVKKILRGKEVIVWGEVISNPDLVYMDEAINQLRLLKVDCVIGLGGGSAIDSAKILAVTLSNHESPSLVDYFRAKNSFTWKSRLPLIVVPTTAGTGSEVTPFATVWDHQNYKKYSLSGDFVFPDLALLDESLTLTLNEEDTLYPALDTISHALESLWNKNITPISKIYSINSLQLSFRSLEAVFDSPKSLVFRKQLLMSSCFAGLAISQTRTAIAHAVSYPLTVCYGVPHGLACSFALSDILMCSQTLKYFSSDDCKLFENISNMLEKFHLDKRISKYLCDENMECVFKESDIGRLENYSGDCESAVKAVMSKLTNIRRGSSTTNLLCQ